MSDPYKSLLVAKKLGKWHSVNIYDKKKLDFFFLVIIQLIIHLISFMFIYYK